LAKSKTVDISFPLRLANQLTLEGIPSPTFEYKFHPKRLWRFDLCWCDDKIAVEIDGGVWKTINKKTGELETGRHNQPEGYLKDLEKLNHAQLLGYSVYRFTTGQVTSTQAKRFMLKVFEELLINITGQQNFTGLDLIDL